MLFSEFWHEGEICILFADTNVGKSILAVQIGNAISRGVAIKNFKLEAKKQSVFYLDFELSDKQFQNRYSLNYESNYLFDAKPSMADIAIFPFIRQFAAVDNVWWKAAAYPRLQAWLKTWVESDLFKSVMTKNPTYVG